jgi:hypothetical protein
MSTVAYIENQIAELEEHAEKFGLGSEGKRRLEKFRTDLTAATFQEKKDLASLARTLHAAIDEYTDALDVAIVALEAYVTAREELAKATAALKAVQRETRNLPIEYPPTDSFGHRCIADTPEGYETRKLRDRASIVNGTW